MTPLEAILLAVLGTIAALVVVVLPGFALGRLLGILPARDVGALVVAVPLAVAYVAAIGSLLVGLGAFDPRLLAAACVAASLFGALPFVRWAVDLARRYPIVAVGALALAPWVVSALAPGFPPAGRYQWYYAELGRQLSLAQGIPELVAEYGQPVRWLPDYLFFDLAAEAYSALTWLADPAAALSWWRVPIVAVGLIHAFALLRLWTSREGALIGTGVLAGSTFFLNKFDAYKPEALGVILGMAAVWLVVRGVRDRHAGYIALVGVALGLAMAVHAIAATVFAATAVAAALVEVAALGEGRRTALSRLVASAAGGAALVVLTGWALQGRLSVASDAIRPRITDGVDPTWIFQLRSTGVFEDRAVPDPLGQLASRATAIWPTIDPLGRDSLWLAVTLVLGLLLVLAFAAPTVLRAMIAIGLAAALVGGAIAFFALAFDTYVPRNTGLSRLAQYLPFFAAAMAALIAEGFVATVRRLGGVRGRVSLAVAAVIAVLFVVPTATPFYGQDVAISAAGLEALERLRDEGAPGDVVLSNALTHGTVEFFTGLEDPLDGRQPFIEEPGFLSAVNRFLLDAHRFFIDPSADLGWPQRTGVRWLLVVDDPRTLGAVDGLGGSTASFRSLDGWTPVSDSGGLVLLRRDGAAAGGPPATGTRSLALPTIAAAGVLAAFYVVIALVLGWRGPPRWRRWPSPQPR